MPQTDSRVDSYIEDAPAYARPILKHLRTLIHKVCPGAQEAIKWNCPFFDYNGSILCAIVAHKKHCKLMFWKANLMRDPEGILHLAPKHPGGTIPNLTSVQDLPSDKILTAYIREAMTLNEMDFTIPGKAGTKKS